MSINVNPTDNPSTDWNSPDGKPLTSFIVVFIVTVVIVAIAHSETKDLQDEGTTSEVSRGCPRRDEEG